MNKYLSTLEAIAERVDREQDALIAAVRNDLLVPFCNRTGMRFTAGMGSWSFDKLDRYGFRQYLHFGDPIPGIPKTLSDFLHKDALLSRNDLGSLMQDYTPPNYRQSP